MAAASFDRGDPEPFEQTEFVHFHTSLQGGEPGEAVVVCWLGDDSFLHNLAMRAFMWFAAHGFIAVAIPDHTADQEKH